MKKVSKKRVKTRDLFEELAVEAKKHSHVKVLIKDLDEHFKKPASYPLDYVIYQEEFNLGHVVFNRLMEHLGYKIKYDKNKSKFVITK